MEEQAYKKFRYWGILGLTTEMIAFIETECDTRTYGLLPLRYQDSPPFEAFNKYKLE